MGITPEEYEAMWKLASEFIDAILDKPEPLPSGESGRPEPVAGAHGADASEA